MLGQLQSTLITGSNTVAIQTSFTDLSNIGKKSQMQDFSVQCVLSSMESTPLTTSSSQTNSSKFSHRNYPIEANVTQIRVEGSDSSSIPSSYDPDKTLTQSGLTDFPPLMENSVGQTYHNRGRRNAFPTIVLEHEEDDEKIPPFILTNTQEGHEKVVFSHIVAVLSS